MPHSQSYTKICNSLIHAQNFEQLCQVFHDGILSIPQEKHKEFYEFLAQNPTVIASIVRFENHEQFKTAIWSVIYEEPRDFTDLSLLAESASHPLALSPIEADHALTVFDDTHYPVVIDNTTLPMIRN